MFHCGMITFIFLQVAVFLSLPYDGVNGEETRITQRWIHNTQGPIRDEIHPGLRDKNEDEKRTSAMITRETINLAADQAKKFTAKLKTRTRRRRTTIYFQSALDPCHHLALNCLRAYQTGKVCGRSTYVTYFTFKNYCMLDYTNCMARYQAWQAIHMGECLKLTLLSSAMQMSELSSKLMDGIYMPEPE